MNECNSTPIYEQKWPDNELEYINKCVVCDCENRKLIHGGLVDNVFNCAPGKWNLHECSNCKTLYLDPRPSNGSIHRAYRNYYTHESVVQSVKYSQLSFVSKLKRQMANGYRNWRFGGEAMPASKIGAVVMYLFPKLRLEINQLFRHIPKFTNGKKRILDIGFGSGSFLERAKSIGWQETGVDFDEKVVESAKSRGLNVYLGGVEVLEDKQNYFDVITLSHVIEHLYDPVGTLKACYKLLKPNGTICLETPNIMSYGHDVFQENWRGIETPRHLVLFNKKSLVYALEKAGFDEVKSNKIPTAVRSMFRKSENLEKERMYSDYKNRSVFPNLKIYFYRMLTIIFVNKIELLNLKARKLDK